MFYLKKMLWMGYLMGREYTPDRWRIVEITPKDICNPPYFRILASWYGGFVGSDSWKLSSGITEVKDKDTYWEVPNYSGSVYILYKNRKGMSSLGSSVLARYKSDAEDLMTINECEIEDVLL